MEEIKISLAAARVNAGMTQAKVAELMKVSNKTIVNWETGLAEPSYATIKALSDLYGIPMDNIFLPEKLTKS